MELFHGVNVNWLGKKWYFLAFSMIFSVAGIISMAVHFAHTGYPVPLGVDFRGGTEVQVKFAQTPDVGQIRAATVEAGIKDATVVIYDVPSANEVLISFPEQSQREFTRYGPSADRERAAGSLREPIRSSYRCKS